MGISLISCNRKSLFFYIDSAPILVLPLSAEDLQTGELLDISIYNEVFLSYDEEDGYFYDIDGNRVIDKVF
jgi:hypothetical protein